MGITSEDSIGRVHKERFHFAPAPGNALEVVSSYAGGDPYRAGLEYADNLTGGNAAWSEPLELAFGHDAIGRLETIDWDKAPASSSQNPLAEYGWVGGLRRSRSVFFQSTGVHRSDTTFGYDTYGRLLQIVDDVWTASITHAVESQFDYEYDAASNLIREQYLKVDGSAGDRFAYDGYHRLAVAWMGVNAATMAASGNPTGFSSSTMHEQLTYGLDNANNREKVESETAGGTFATDYTVQDPSHAQGPSNRYAEIGSGSNLLVQEHDERGNLIYDGVLAYRYDYRNRLQEVWRVVPTEGLAAQPGEKFALIEEESTEEVREEVKQDIPDLMRRVLREHMNPTFRARLKKSLRGGVIRIMPLPQGGGGRPSFAPAPANLELCAVYIYDGFNRRTITVPIGLVETQFHTFDGWREVGQHGLDQATFTLALPNKQFVWGSRLDELIGYRRKHPGTGAWENYHVLHGGQDTAAKLVDEDGVVVEQYEYDPYGRVTVYDGSGSLVGDGSASGVGLPFLWKSIRLDQETGLLYMRNRYYSTATGRFLTRDPLGTWADVLNAGNGYAYVGNRPLVCRDPLGLQGDGPRQPLEVGGIVGFTASSGQAFVHFGDGTSMPLPPGPMPGPKRPMGSITPGRRTIGPVNRPGAADLWILQRVFFMATVEECWDIRIDIRGVSRGSSVPGAHPPVRPLPGPSERGEGEAPLDRAEWREDGDVGRREDPRQSGPGSSWGFTSTGDASRPTSNVDADQQHKGRGLADPSGNKFFYGDTVRVPYRNGDSVEWDLEFRMVAIHRCTGLLVVLAQQKLGRVGGRVEGGKLVNPGNR